jgi:UDP-glucose 4-epimerase
MARKPTILITGIAGFIGSNLADRLLKEGYSVIGIDNLSQGVLENVSKEAEFHRLDIRSKEIYPIFKKAEIVFHLAAKNSLVDCQNDPVETMDINVTGTANVFEAALRAKVKKVIYAQSSAVEEGDDRLKGFYAISKMATQWIAEGYKAAHNLTTVGLRYFNVYGPRQDYRRTIPPVMSAFIIKFLKGEPPVIYEGAERNKRDFIHIEDINNFHLLCITDERTNNRMFRLGSGKNYSVVEIFEAIKKILKADIKPVIKPREKNDIPTETLADISEAKSLGWAPKIELEEGLRGMIEYLKGEFVKGRIK